MRSITISIASVDTIPSEALGSHLATCVEAGRIFEKVQISTPINVLPHSNARTLSMSQALENGSDYILYIDDDTLMPYGGLGMLLETLETNKAQAVSGHYYRRGFPYTCVWSVVKDNFIAQADAKAGIHPIDTSGLGCALIDVNFVAEKMTPPLFQMTEMASGNLVATDDVTFFTKLKKAGGVLLGDARVRCTHLGERVEINDQSVLRLRQNCL
jgi:hypothetical protein